MNSRIATARQSADNPHSLHGELGRNFWRAGEGPFHRALFIDEPVQLSFLVSSECPPPGARDIVWNVGDLQRETVDARVMTICIPDKDRWFVEIPSNSSLERSPLKKMSKLEHKIHCPAGCARQRRTSFSNCRVWKFRVSDVGEELENERGEDGVIMRVDKAGIRIRPADRRFESFRLQASTALSEQGPVSAAPIASAFTGAAPEPE